MTRKREEKWRKKDIYIYIYTRGPSALYGFRLDGVKWPCMELRRRQDNVQHSLAGVVLVYSPFFQLASSCSTSSRIWINRMALLIRRLEPFTHRDGFKGLHCRTAVSNGKSLEVFLRMMVFRDGIMLLRWQSGKRKLLDSVSKSDENILWYGIVSLFYLELNVLEK